MAKKKEPEKQGNEELFLALDLLEKEKGIPAEYMLDKIKKAISTACKNNYGNEDVDIDVDREKGVFNVYLRKEIVEEVEDLQPPVPAGQGQAGGPHRLRGPVCAH